MGGLRTGCLGQIGNIIRLLFSYYLLVLKRTVFVMRDAISRLDMREKSIPQRITVIFFFFFQIK